uniref:Uncharacterized protein n=1 Tax=Anopheles farauti TaxID=69004 RepID=A0A182Q2H3_9DIPT
MLSRPPQATKFPDGAYAHVITQDERSGIACTLLVVCESHTISLPSCEADTRFRESLPQCMANESQEPVATAMPFSVTPKQDTRLSCPAKMPARSAFIVSQTLQLKSS